MVLGDNNQLDARVLQLEFKKILTAVFEKQAYFRDLFGGSIEALDGVQENQTAFFVKTSDIPVVVGEYNTDPNVAFGTGTNTSNRFGERKEIIYENTPADYSWGWAFHEGLDRFTVNNNLEAALADRFKLQAQSKIAQFNAAHGAFISDNAGKTINLGDFTDFTADNVLKLFNELSAYYTNIEAVGHKVAKVSTGLYNAIVDHPLATTGKHSSANVDQNTILLFKGFAIQEIPDAQFKAGEVAYTYISDMARAFTGINTTRAIESEGFDGLALQGAGKAGQFILPDNKPALVKVTTSAVGV